MGHALDLYVARQPILDRCQRTYGYELLFRDGPVNAFRGADPDVATAKVIDTSFFVLGIDSLTGGRRAFVNFARDAIVHGYASALPTTHLVVEILESVPADADVLKACRALKGAGYAIALDDVATSAPPEALLALADIVKVDFGQVAPAERSWIARELKRHRGVKLLAEKVETEVDFAEAHAAGFEYFQGYFFARPTLVSGRDIPASKVNVLQLLREVHRPDPDHAQVANAIKREVALALKLLRHLATANWGLKRPVESVDQAILLLGDEGLRTWASVVAIAMLGSDRPNELVAASVMRASFCERLLVEIGLADHAHEGFLVGLFSMIDALLGLPLAEAVDRLPLADDVRAALLGKPGTLRAVHDVVLAWERGDWTAVARTAAVIGASNANLGACHGGAAEFASSTATAGRTTA